jgi:amidohydrolase
MTDYYRLAHSQYEFTQAVRRDLHRHPEMGFQEFRTAGIVARVLKSLGIEVQERIAKTGVVGLIEGVKKDPVVMLRFDMDALPIIEETGASYASENHGVMHACGHDGHVAVGLTVAKMLCENRENLHGTVKLVFQPAEEGLGGAEKMIQEGVLTDPKPEAAFGFHVWNDEPVGWFGITPGPVMAAADIFEITLTGKGGHGALPNMAVDPVITAAHLITALQTIVSRNVSPLETAVVTIATVHAGEAFNVIPSKVMMKGTIRTFTNSVRDLVHRRFTEIVQQITKGFGCEAIIDIRSLTPALVNDPQLVQRVAKLARDLIPEAEIDQEYTTMGSEDMAFFLNIIPGCFIFAGSCNRSRGLDAAHHHPKFDIDEQSLPGAAALLCSAVEDYLSK